MDSLTSQVAQASARQRPYTLHGYNTALSAPPTRPGTVQAALKCIIRLHAAAARPGNPRQCCNAASSSATSRPGSACGARLLHVGACDPGIGILPRVPPARLLAWVGERAGRPVVAEALGARDDLRTARPATSQRAHARPRARCRSRAQGARTRARDSAGAVRRFRAGSS